jgi:hypothetical protein
VVPAASHLGNAGCCRDRGLLKGAEVLEVRPAGGDSPLPAPGEEGFEEAGKFDGNKGGG